MSDGTRPRNDDRAAVAERMLRLFDKRAEIEAVWLFPPRSRGSAGAAGSTDLGVLFREDATPADGNAWQDRMTQELGRAGVERPRVVLLEQAEATLRHRAIERGQAIFFRDALKVKEFRARTWMEYVDREAPMSQRIASMRGAGAKLSGDAGGHERVEALRQHTERIGATLRAGGDRFATDRGIQDSILFNLLQACQAAEDLFAALLARTGEGSEDALEQHDPFEAAIEGGLVPVDLAQRLAAVLRLRNVVLYRYAELDLGIVLKHLPNAIDALDELARTWESTVSK
ncbi:MAG: DUF86 domain-containing protein [bacterium]